MLRKRLPRIVGLTNAECDRPFKLGDSPGTAPFACIRDMLVRISVEPMSRIREPLPDGWNVEARGAQARATTV